MLRGVKLANSYLDRDWDATIFSIVNLQFINCNTVCTVMERFETIIKNGKISDITARVYVWALPGFLLFASAWAVYKINFGSLSAPCAETDFYQNGTNFIFSIFFFLLMLFNIYLLFRGEKILRIVFCKDFGSNKDKEEIVKKLMLANKWKLKKSDQNYYQFWENNILSQSYYITIVFDRKGFYVKAIPF